MKLYIFTPNKEAIFTKEIEQNLKEKFEVVFYTEIKPLSEHLDFINDESEKVVALDPDFFDWKFSKEEIDLCKNVRAFCLQTTSFSWIDIEYAKEKNIPVLNLKGFSSEAVAEFAFMLALGVARKLPLIMQANYTQDFVAHQGIELRGKTAGIIGLGNIGKNIAEKCKGFGMKTVYWSKNTRNEIFEYSELDNLLKNSDVIFVALAQNTDTQNILTDELILSMKNSAIFVSIAHKVFNEDLIIKLVQENKLYGYGTEEDNGSPLKHSGNILIFPAVAWATNESMSLNGKMWSDSILKVSENIFLNKVN